MSNVIETSKSAQSAHMGAQIGTDTDQSKLSTSTEEPNNETAKVRSRRSGGANKQSASGAVGSADGSIARDVSTEKRNKKPSKHDIVLDLLRRDDGATIDELIDATGWQAHSVRGFLSGTVRKKLKLNLISDVVGNGVRRYRVALGGGSDVAQDADQPVPATSTSEHPVTGSADGEQAS